MENTKIKKQKIFYVTLLVTTFVFAGIALVIIFPLVLKLYAAKDQFELNKIELADANREYAEQERFQHSFDVLEKHQDIINKAVIRKDSVVEFIENIENLSQKAGLSVFITSYQPPKTTKKNVSSTEIKKEELANGRGSVQFKENEKNKQYLSIMLLGTYPQILDFLYRLENSYFVFIIDSVEISAKTSVNISALESTNSQTSAQTTSAKIIVSFIPEK